MFVTTFLGETLLLRYMLNNAQPTNVIMHLYSNNWTPLQTDTLAQYTESTAAGYAPITLQGSEWSFIPGTLAGQFTPATTTTASYATQTFTFASSGIVYGWYITDNANSQVIWAEIFPNAPVQIPIAGGSIAIDPTLPLV